MKKEYKNLLLEIKMIWKKIATAISPIVNNAVTKKFGSVGISSPSDMMKEYLSLVKELKDPSNKGVTLNDISVLKAEYWHPKDKDVFRKIGKEYQWNKDFSDKLDKLTESIKRFSKIKEICSNVTWETHPNKFCICFYIKKQLLDYSSND